MIPQPFIKGAGERVSFTRYEYVPNADIIFDFGNPLCTSAWGSNIVYNVGNANITGSLIPYNNPSPVYPTLLSANSGSVLFERIATVGSNYVQWNWNSTKNQSNVVIYKPGNTGPSGEQGFYGAGAVSGSSNSIYMNINTSRNIYAGGYDNSNTRIDDIFNGPVLQTGSVEGRNGWNQIVYTSNGASDSNLYLNQSAPINSTTTISRVTSGTQTFKFPFTTSSTLNFQSYIIAFLQYPFLLSPKQIRQTYKVFSQSF